MVECIFQGIGHGRTIGDIPASLRLKVEGSNVKVEGSHDILQRKARAGPGRGLQDFRQESSGLGNDVPIDQPQRACRVVRVKGELDHGCCLLIPGSALPGFRQ